MNETAPPPPQKPPTPAPSQSREVAVKPIDAAKAFLADPHLREQIKITCSRVMTPERVTRIAMTAVLSSPRLAECFLSREGKASIAKALLTATQRGLEVDGRQGHLVPFRCKLKNGQGYTMQAQFIPGYQGLVDLAYNHPNVSAIWAKEVYEKDHFVYQEGLTRVLEHVPIDDENPGKLIAAYAVCETKIGGKIFVVLKNRDIVRIKQSSKGSSDVDSPWNTHPAAMWKKSAIRALAKMMPQSSELRDLLADDDEAERARDKVIDVKTVEQGLLENGHGNGDDNDQHWAERDNIPVGGSAANPVAPPPPPPATTTTTSTRRTKSTLVETALSPQETLSNLVVTTCHSSFDRLMEVAIDHGWLTDACPAGNFDELPKEFCERMLANPSILVPMLVPVSA